MTSLALEDSAVVAYDEERANISRNNEPLRFSTYQELQLPSWFFGLRSRFQAIEQLADGWDSNGAAAPLRGIVANAERLIMEIALREPRLASPSISPTPSGGVQFAWEKVDRYFEIELIDESTAEYFFENRRTRKNAVGEIRLGEPINPILSYLDFQ